MTNPIQDNTTDSGNTPDPRNENDKGSQQGTLNTSPATTNQAADGNKGGQQNAAKATGGTNIDKAVSNEKRQQDERGTTSARDENKGRQQNTSKAAGSSLEQDVNKEGHKQDERNAPNARSESKGGQQTSADQQRPLNSEQNRYTKHLQAELQPRREEAKSENASRAKQEATGAEEAKALSQPTPYKGKDSSAGQSESKSQREEPASSGGVKRTEGSGATSIPFTQTAPGDKLTSEPGDMDDVAKNASQRYRDKYAEVMRDFHTGQLRGQSNQIIKGRDEAKAMAAEQAKHIDASAEQKGKQ